MMLTEKKTAQHINNQADYSRAKSLRKNLAPAEKLLWEKLRTLPDDRALKFRRQHPIHPYIVDFACVACKLVVEIDGVSHDARQAYDDERSRTLQNRGYTVIRFTNDDVYNRCEGIVQMIVLKAEEILQSRLKTPPLTPPQGEGNHPC